MKARVLALVSVVLFGCAATTPPVHLKSSFDKAEAERMLLPGKNRISGSALVRQQGGGVVHCGGNAVILFPVTAYATERMEHLYGSHERGFNPVGVYGRHVTFDPNLLEYWQATRKSVCDAQGAFEFDNLGDGDYYVATVVTWTVGYSAQGGTLMQRVSLSGGETKKIVLTP